MDRPQEDIAIIGLACRLPGGVDSIDRLWTLLTNGQDGWSPMPADRFSTEGFYHPNPNKRGAFNAKGAHFLTEDISLFDAQFFNITANEASAVDPQHRILLECSYEALENAGITVESIAGSQTGVFMGASYPDYSVHLLRDTETCPMYHGTGTAEALLSNRISYFFDLHGPSMTIETACSSALSSLHVACQSLQAGDCSQAIVGACHLNVVPDTFVSLSKSQLLSPEGRSYAFDERATSGYGRGEGAVAILIKSLHQAIEDGDPVRAVIRGTGINQDGKTAGITQPSGAAQERLMRSVYARAGLDPLHTQFVEAHGTGTAVGDPIETAAIASVFCKDRHSNNKLHLGSLKSQAGHLEGACGIASVIKTVLMLEKGVFPPQGNFNKANPKVPLRECNMTVATSTEEWKPISGGPRRASVNNFGFGGTNAHAVIEEAPSKSCTPLTNGSYPNGEIRLNGDTPGLGICSQLIVLSAKDEYGVKRQAEKLIEYLTNRQEKIKIEDLAFTLNVKRSHFSWRSAIVAQDRQELIDSLQQLSKPTRSISEPRVCFVFTGQGAQWVGMGKDLFAYKVFHAAMTEAENCLRKFGASWSLQEELQSAGSRLNEATIAQPACTAIQISLVKLLRSWGIVPYAVIGHSSGEIAAAYAVGALSSSDAMLVAYQRGVFSSKLSEQHPELHGSMLALGMNEKEAEVMVKEIEVDSDEGEAVIACVNSPSSVTVSGDQSVISKVSADASAKGIFNRRLRVGVAYHSHHMELVAQEYHRAIANIDRAGTQTARFFSSLAGHEIGSSLLDSHYWVQNLIAPVQFSQALQSLLEKVDASKGDEQQKLVMVEVGPHPALEGPAKQTFKAINLTPAYIPTIVRQRNSVVQLQQSAGILFSQRAAIDLAAINEAKSLPATLTDLPPYPWKHTERYWYESRISQNHRLRKFRRHDLLGSLTPAYSDLEPTWRNVLDVEQVPWLRDHRVQGNVVFPLSGYLAMAVEAARQKAALRNFHFNEDTCYLLRDVVASRALVLPESSDVEMMTTFKPYAESVRSLSDTWDEFRITSWENERGWIEHCRGHVCIQDHALAREKLIWAQPNKVHDYSVDWDKFLAKLGKSGIEYGPSFRGVLGASAGKNYAVSTVSVPDTEESMPNKYESRYVMHPGTLDAVCQATFPAFTCGRELERPFVPTFIGKMTLAHESHAGKNSSLRAFWTTKNSDNIIGTGAVTNERGALILQMQDLTLVPISEETEAVRQDDLCASVSWKPCIDLLSRDKLIELLARDQISEEEKLKFDIFEQASFFYTQKALTEIRPDEVSTFLPHHQKMYKWLKAEHEAALNHGLPMQTKDWLSMRPEDKELFLKNVMDMRPAGELLCRIGQALPAICRQEIDPLSIMFENELLSRWYKNNASLDCGYARNKRFVDLLGHQNPFLNIIEIGGGTAGTTVPTLESLGGYDGKLARFAKYTFTDVSVGFFENAKRKLEKWGPLINYAKLDIEQDPEEQGFVSGEYDLVIAANVLHATSDMDRTLKHVRKLLKPGGKLALLEVTKPQLQHLIFATLPGWWLAEGPGREKGPVMDENEWQERLLKAGFSGLDCSLQDFPGEKEQNGSMMYATAVETGAREKPEIVIVCDSEPASVDLVSLQEHLQEIGHPVISHVAGAHVEGKNVIVLEELNRRVLRNLDGDSFAWLQKLYSSAASVLWVIQDAQLKSKDPDASMAVGLARTVRSETGMRVVTLDIDGQAQVNVATKTIADVFKRNFLIGTTQQTEMEYVQQNGIVHIPRLQLQAQLNRELDHEMFGDKSDMQPLKQDGRPLKLTIPRPGQLDSLLFVDDKVHMAEDQVQIEIQHVGLNFKDILIALGQVPKEPLGGELSGLVAAVGDDVTAFKPGDLVCAAPSGSFATHKTCSAAAIRKIPRGITSAEAASIPIAFVTAYYSLIDIGRLSRGESVLIHAAAGGVGQAAIQVAKMVGAIVYATVGSAEKRESISKLHDIRQERIFNSRDASFEQGLMQVTAGKGVDVVLNSLSGELLHASWKCLAPYGRFVEIGKRDVLDNARLAMQGFEKNCSFAAVDLGHIRMEKPDLFHKTFHTVFDLFEKGVFKPLPVIVYAFSELESAFRTMVGGKHMGKIVIEARSADRVNAILQKSGTKGLRSDATYLLSGGTGGLGRSLSKWLASQGAKNIVMASRSGKNNEKAIKVIDEVARLGARLEIFQCDVSNSREVALMVEKCKEDMPPIRGVIHGAMVLKDMLFEKSDLAQWSSICTPKIPGCWNLHNATLDTPLDFFIMLGSASGIIGNRGQAAYAATCAFLNAFAQYRASLGLAATCIDIGLVEDVGYAAEQWQLKAWLETLYSEYVKERELHAVIHASINARISPGATVVIGMRVRANDPEFFWSSDPKFSHLRRGVYNPLGETSAGASGAISVPALIKQAKNLHELIDTVTTCLMQRLSSVLMIPLDEMTRGKSVASYGLDSLVAVEVRNWISKEMGAKIPLLTLMSSPSIEALAKQIAAASSLVDAKVKTGT